MWYKPPNTRIPSLDGCIDVDEGSPEGGRYRCESLDSGFTTELTGDAAGLVVDYAELWRRLWPR
jgi:hypothetical protein